MLVYLLCCMQLYIRKSTTFLKGIAVTSNQGVPNWPCGRRGITATVQGIHGNGRFAVVYFLPFNTVHQCRKEVYIPRLTGCTFPGSDSSKTHTLSLSSNFPSKAVLGSAIQPVADTEDLYSGGLTCLSPPSGTVSQNPAISGQLSYLHPLSRSSYL